MSNVKYMARANTPAEFQAAVVKWLNGEVIDHRVRARALARTKKVAKEHMDKADALSFAANFIQAIVIEPTPDAIPPWEKIAAQKADICKNECLTLLIDGNKWIEAIRLYRQKTSSPLKEAREVIESWRAMLALSEIDITEHCKAIAKDQKIWAIRDYRFWGKYNGREISLKDALDFVNSLV